MNNFKKYASVPVVNMESATSHPLQALADAITMEEYKTIHKSFARKTREIGGKSGKSFGDIKKGRGSRPPKSGRKND